MRDRLTRLPCDNPKVTEGFEDCDEEQYCVDDLGKGDNDHVEDISVAFEKEGERQGETSNKEKRRGGVGRPNRGITYS
jgi:hypothetical protein